MQSPSDLHAHSRRPEHGGRVVPLSGHIADVQRARILTAMVDVACERGAGDVSVTHIVARSGVSRRTFYSVFADREECFLCAFEQAFGLARQRVLDGCDPEAPWAVRVRGGLVAFLGFLDEQPRLGRVLIVESLTGGVRVCERRAEAVAQLTSVIEQGAGQDAMSGALVGEGVVGAVLSILATRLSDPRHGPLIMLVNDLMGMIVLPFLGRTAARRELARTVSIPEAHREHDDGPSLSFDPFKEAGMRLTYRTVRTLMAVAEKPGASNREIARTAEVADQGQISRLLGRMHRVGMIANNGGGARQGAPNEWVLTDSGEGLVESIRRHTESSLATQLRS